MDWNFAIERCRVPLLGIVVELFAEIGLTEGGTIERVSKPLYRYVLGILRTAESAVRRLIIAAARDIVVEHKPRRPAPAKPKTSSKDKSKADGEGKAKRKRRSCSNCSTRSSAFAVASKRCAVDLSPASTSSMNPIRGRRYSACYASSRPPRQLRHPFRRGGDRRRRHRRCQASDPPSPRHRGCTARHPAPGACGSRAGRPVPKKSAVLSAGAPCALAGRRDSASGQIHEVDEILKECHWLALSAHPPLDDTS